MSLTCHMQISGVSNSFPSAKFPLNWGMKIYLLKNI